MNFASSLKQLQKARGLTFHRIAEAMETSGEDLSAMFRGELAPTNLQISKLCKSTSTSVTIFYWNAFPLKARLKIALDEVSKCVNISLKA